MTADHTKKVLRKKSKLQYTNTTSTNEQDIPGVQQNSSGIIKWYGGLNKNTGRENEYGFLVFNNNQELYFHRSNTISSDIPLVEGTLVTFTKVGKSDGRFFADHVLAIAPPAKLGPLEQDALSSNPKLQTFAFQNLEYSLGPVAYVDFLSAHLNRLSQTALDHAARAVPAIYFLGEVYKKLRLALPVWARYQIYAACPDLSTYLQEIISFLRVRQKSNDSEGLDQLFWKNHGFGRHHRELEEFAPSFLKKKIWLRCILPEIPLQDQAIEIEARRQFFTYDDWRIVIQLLIDLIKTKPEALATLKITPSEHRLDLFSQIANIDLYREAITNTLDEVLQENSYALQLSKFWNKHAPSYPSHWLFFYAPPDVKKQTFQTYYTQLLQILSKPYGSEIETKIWQSDVEYLKINTEDEELASIWAGRKSNRDSCLAMMLSARVAEKCVAELYSSLGYLVHDTAKQQLGGRSQDWITHDLDIEGYGPVDVKNARRSINSETFYVEHIVKHFKKDMLNRNVRIAGVLSPYLQLKFIRSPEIAWFNISPIIYLGETSLPDINHLAIIFSTARLEIQPVSDPRHTIAPWYYDYPDQIYFEAHSRFFSSIKNLEWPSDAHWAYLLDGENVHAYLPSFLIVGRPLPHPFKRLMLAWEAEFYDFLLARRNKRFTLPVLFFSVLAYTLEQLGDNNHRDQASIFTASEMRRFFFIDPKPAKGPSTNPLGLIDPTGLISNLIDTLDVLWQHRERTGLLRYTRFRLIGLGLLQGQLENTIHWETIIAYCGGLAIEVNKAGHIVLNEDGTPIYKGKCGYFPLVLGREVICHVCHKLVCQKCGFCSNKCHDIRVKELKEDARPKNIFSLPEVITTINAEWLDDELPPIDIYENDRQRGREEYDF
jgi:hypothetical protein